VRKAFLIALMVFPLAAGVASATLHPSLRLVRMTPPTFRGSGFHARERVTVSLNIVNTQKVRVRADAQGRFRVRLSAVPKCGAWKVRALGSRGSRAVYRHRACAAEGSGVEGIVMRGPITPICTPETPCDAPAPNVTVQALQDGAVIATTTTDRNGRFKLSLAPGDYMVRTLGDAKGQAVHVSASKLTEVALYVDTGIR
jgi:carboxypeptidase family protein